MSEREAAVAALVAAAKEAQRVLYHAVGSAMGTRATIHVGRLHATQRLLDTALAAFAPPAGATTAKGDQP